VPNLFSPSVSIASLSCTAAADAEAEAGPETGALTDVEDPAPGWAEAEAVRTAGIAAPALLDAAAALDAGTIAGCCTAFSS
jgi:hypothetical protein